MKKMKNRHGSGHVYISVVVVVAIVAVVVLVLNFSGNQGGATGEAFRLGRTSSAICPAYVRPSEVIGIMYGGQFEQWNTRNYQYKMEVEQIYDSAGQEKADVVINGDRLVGLIADASETLSGGSAFGTPQGYVSLHFLSRDHQNPARSYIVFKIREK